MKPRIALITGWTDPARLSLAEISLNLLNTLKPFSSSLTWLATNLTTEVPPDNQISIVRMKSKFIPRRESTLKLIPYMLLFQFKVAWAILKLLRKVDVFVFATGSDFSFLPMLLVKLAGKKVIIRSDGRPSFLVRKHFKNPGKVKIFLLGIVETLSYSLADRIMPETRQLVEEYKMHKYDAKISIGSQYVDTSNLKEMKKLSERQYDVGFIGRLIKEKGALEFSKSLPLILKNIQSKFIIIGNGHLRDEIEQVVIKNNVQNETKLLGWTEKKSLLHYLKDIKLVVVPSDYEGLSSLILEAMACGTLVLATPVGGTPDVVREGETGFILENSSPECIARNVIRVLNHPDLDRIRENAHAQIDQIFSYRAAVERYKNIFESLEFEVDNSLGFTLSGKTPKTPVTPGQRVV
jgi:glycosyltransferase involved in cell wall biosynthesis